MRFIRKMMPFWVPLTLLSIIAFIIQTHIYFQIDVGYLLHETFRLLQGETYFKNIFEPNPPLILFLSVPPWIFTKLTAIDITITMRFYIISLAFISCSFSYYLIKKLFNETLVIYGITYAVLFTLLFLPAHQFGQREHFLMIFIFPYLFAKGLRLENKDLHPGIAFIIGLMAGIGFSIKPHFLLSFLLIEIYCLTRQKNLLRTLKIETLTTLSFMLIYTLIVCLLYKSYFYNVYPLWWPFYKAIAHPWLEVLTNFGFLFSLGPFIFYFLLEKYNNQRALTHIFLLALAGFIVAFLQPRVTWYYHILPALSMVCVIYAILFFQFLARNPIHPVLKLDFIFTMGLFFIFFAFPIQLTTTYLNISLREFKQPDVYAKLIAFLKQEAPHNQYLYFANTHNLSILEYYAKATNVGRFPSFWWFYDLTLEKYLNNAKAKKYQEKYFPGLYNLVAEDLTSKKPKFVIVDIESAEKNLGLHLNYINELSNSKNFRIAWKNYRYYKTIDQFRIYVRSE